jgi:hypothetical protein
MATSDIVGGIEKDGVKGVLTCCPDGNLFNFSSARLLGRVGRVVAIVKFGGSLLP